MNEIEKKKQKTKCKSFLIFIPLFTITLLLFITVFYTDKDKLHRLVYVNGFSPISEFDNTTLQYKLYEEMLEKNYTKERLLAIFDHLYPYHTMHQKVFFFDPTLDNPYPPEKQGIPGTEEVQKIIYENQFPKNCSERNFLFIPNIYSSGIGSYIHVIGTYIGRGLELNRTVIYDPRYHYAFSNTPNCHGKKLFDCYFKPLSSCSVRPEEINFSNPKYMKTGIYARTLVPKRIIDIIQNTATPKSLYYYYWRLQTAFFLTKFNDEFNDIILKFRKEHLVNPKNHYDVSVHIRCGDKSLEMQVVDPNYFIYPLRVLKKIYDNKKISVFVSSDDQNAIDKILKYSDEFDFSYFDYKRTEGGFNLYKISDHYREAVTSFANLKESIDVKHVIGTLNSNWNRLIMELNLQCCGNKSFFPYIEVGDVPCITPNQCKPMKQKIYFGW